jgi:hypothetical protein
VDFPGGEIETLAFVVNRRRRPAGFDQLDPPTVHDLMVSGRRHGDGPAEMIGKTQTQVTRYSVMQAPAG